MLGGVQLGEVGREVPLRGGGERGARRGRVEAQDGVQGDRVVGVVALGRDVERAVGADREALGVGLADAAGEEDLLAGAPAVGGVGHPEVALLHEAEHPALVLHGVQHVRVRGVEHEAAHVAALRARGGLPGARLIGHRHRRAARPRLRAGGGGTGAGRRFGLARQGVRVAGAVAADDRDRPARAERRGARRTDVAADTEALRAAPVTDRREHPGADVVGAEREARGGNARTCPGCGSCHARERLVAVGEPVGERGAVEDVDLVVAAEVVGVVRRRS